MIHVTQVPMASTGWYGEKRQVRWTGMANDPTTDEQEPNDLASLKLLIGTRVREARKRLKMSQSELGALIGSGHSHVNMIESGEMNVTLKSIVKLANALHIKPLHLFIDDEKVQDLSADTAEQLMEVFQLTKLNLYLIAERLQQAELLLAGKRSEAEPPGTPNG